MNKKAPRNKARAGPAVLRFEARLVRSPEAAGSLTLNLPKVISAKLAGMTNVEGTINDHPFRAALESDGGTGQWLRLNKAMREGADVNAGDTVKLAILGPEPEPRIPADLQVAFAASRGAKALWTDLTSLGRRDWIRWIESAKTPETRTRRVTRTVEQLSEGKRRPCCVNVYEFMLSRVRE